MLHLDSFLDRIDRPEKWR